MPWGLPTLYYKHNLSGLTATSTASDFDVANLLDRFEDTFWKANNTTTPTYITFDAGVGNTEVADYLFISGHNFNTIAATITLQYSTDNFAADINDAFTPFAPSNDLTLVKEFTSQDKRYWRLKITGTLSAAPFIAICYWGEKSELAFATSSFDPQNYTENVKQNIGSTGIFQGDHEQNEMRRFRLTFANTLTDGPLDLELQNWRDTVKRLNFGVAWEKTDHSSDIWLMRRKPNTYKAPLTRAGGTYRNISFDLVGRKEVA